jgi:hypothetical protein
MPGPGDEMPARAGDGGRLRASHADREQVIDTLKAAFVQGLLDKDEFDLRAGQAFASRTYADLAVITADLPAGLAAAQPLEPARAQGQQPVLRPVPVIAVATAVYASVWGVPFLIPGESDSQGVGFLLMMTTLGYFMVLIIAGAHMLALRQDKRPGGQLPPAGHGLQHMDQDARSRPRRRSLPGSRPDAGQRSRLDAGDSLSIDRQPLMSLLVAGRPTAAGA